MARLRVRLPEAPGRGALTFEFRGGATRLAAELWLPRAQIRERLLAAEDRRAALERAATSTAPEVATAAWVERFRHHRRTGDMSAALTAAERWQAAAETRDLVGAALRAASVAAYLHANAGRSQAAARVALEARVRAARFPVARIRALLDFYLGQALVAAGEGGAADRLLSRAARRLARAGLDELGAYPISVLALVRVRLGRLEEALAVLEAHPLRAGTSTAPRATWLANAGDVLLRLWDAHGKEEDLERGLARLQRSRALFRSLGLHPKARARAAEIALAEARAGRIDAARASLGDLDETDVHGAARGVPTLARARILLAEGRVERARSLLEQLMRSRPGGWDALAGAIDIDARALLARAHRRQGDLEAAAEALSAALAAAHARARRTDLSAAPAAALARHDRLRRETVAALVRAGRTEAAFALDDQHRSTVLARLAPRGPSPLNAEAARYRDTLEAKLGRACLPPSSSPACRARSQRALRALERALSPLELDVAEAPPISTATVARPAAREVAAALRPGERVWVVTSTGARLRGFSLGPDADLSHGPLAPEGLAEAEHIYLVSDTLGDFARVTRALAPRPDGPTTSFVPYASWLTHPLPSKPGPSIIVADTLGDLPGARAEAEDARELLPSARARVGDGVRRRELFSLLRGAGIFHFAGHGELMGRDPWASFLRLGEDAVLTVDDWVRVAPALHLVLLDGCSTSGRTALAGQVGFPQAMLQTGTRAVLATTRPVRDAPARRFVRAFLEADGAARPARAFRAAVRDSLERGRAEGSSFVLWGRRVKPGSEPADALGPRAQTR